MASCSIISNKSSIKSSMMTKRCTKNVAVPQPPPHVPRHHLKSRRKRIRRLTFFRTKVLPNDTTCLSARLIKTSRHECRTLRAEYAAVLTAPWPEPSARASICIEIRICCMAKNMRRLTKTRISTAVAKRTIFIHQI